MRSVNSEYATRIIGPDFEIQIHMYDHGRTKIEYLIGITRVCIIVIDSDTMNLVAVKNFASGRSSGPY